ncbi:esterase/lipase family protein [Oceanobacillus luteolus]|uniref:Esterase/lipase family protein n=1 Tax=Oceanobacillus luteolus TaxID=1274358 RepID=A0ABW4HMT9_9BACI
MKRLNRFLAVCFLGILTAGIHLGCTQTVSAQEEVPPPVLVEDSSSNTVSGKGGNGNDETPGEWYRGETPDNLIADAPVLLFVPGLNNVAQIFWENNDMYETAYQAGYQTAFIQLHDAGGESADMWNNGSLLASKIREISNAFNGKQITVVAYSKGGVDTQTALTYYDAGPYVENVITLSSPHHGSELADLAYSGGAGWLAELIGMQGEGTASMQTAYMADFRAQTDANGNAYQHNYYTIGGTNWGTPFSANWFGGVYLSSYGPNDGVVTVASSNLPGGQELRIGDWNHTSVRSGATFPVFRDYLSGHQLVTTNNSTPIGEEKNFPMPKTNHWVDGGPLTEQDEISVYVEEDVDSLGLQILTAESLTEVELLSPTGEKVDASVKEVQMEEGIFKGASRYVIKVPSPVSGEWKIKTLSPAEENAYLLVADYQSDHLLSAEKGNMLLGNNLVLLHAESSKIDQDSLVATYHVIETNNPKNHTQWQATGRDALSQSLQLDEKDGTYTITIDIEGKTKAGNIFKRSVIYSQ